jgi:hypothetical protein
MGLYADRSFHQPPEALMGRSIVAVLLGIVVAGGLIFALEVAGHRVYPPPEGLDMNDREAMKKYIADAPVGALVYVLLAYAVGGLVGGFLTAWVARRAPVLHGLILGSVFLSLGVVNLLTLPHPAWFVAANLLVFLPPAYLGALLAPRPTPPSPTPAESAAA